MTKKLEKLLADFNTVCLEHNDINPKLNAFLKAKSALLEGYQHQSAQTKFDWKTQLIEAYLNMKNNDAIRQKITVICEQLVSQFQKVIKCKDLQMEVLSNEMLFIKSLSEQEKSEFQKLKKQHEKALGEEKTKTNKALEKLEYKQFEIRELQEKISEYEDEMEELKSTQYQKMLDSIKQEEIMNNQTQTLYKQNTLLKFQLKQQILMKNQLSKHIKNLNDQIEALQLRQTYQKQYTHRSCKTLDRKNLKNADKSKQTKNKQQNTINLIEYKDDFSFKDSIQNDNSTVVHNNIPSFLDLESGSQNFGGYIGMQQSPDRCLMERDVLNLTDRNRSTHSRNVASHLLLSKKNYIIDKQNISDNTLELNDFQQYQPNLQRNAYNKAISQNKDLNSNCSIDKYVPSPRGFGTQERNSLLNKHRRIKSSFCGKSIQEFQQYENNHFIVNSEKLQESIFQEDNQNNNLIDESSIMEYGVNQIVINEQLITSKKQKMADSADVSSHVSAKMINSVQVGRDSSPVANPIDIYYAFFSLTAQCVKLNAKNFSRVISVYFNLEQQYKNVIQKTIPINKWYNYIQDQLQTSLKYIS